jgi:hypothetical protein
LVGLALFGAATHLSRDGSCSFIDAAEVVEPAMGQRLQQGQQSRNQVSTFRQIDEVEILRFP